MILEKQTFIFLIWKKKNIVMETHNQKAHRDEKIYITVYKNSFGEEVHASPEEQETQK